RTPGRSTEIPLEDWRAVSHGGEIEVVRPAGGSPHLSVRPSEGFLFGVAYPLDRTFAADGTGDRLRLAVRGSGRFVLNAVVRTEGGERLFLAFSPIFPTIIKNPEQIDRLVVKCMNDTVHWKCLGFFRPEGLRTVGPLLGYDYVYYRTGEIEEEESFPRHTLALSGVFADEEKKYLGPPRGAEGEMLYDFFFEEPLGSVSLAAFVSHIAPGDRARIDLAVEDGPWQELGEISGFLGRSHWGQELVEQVRGRTRFRLRIALAASDWLPESARRFAPMGLRDLAVGVRYLSPEGVGR
ncbi:MAG: hypothetical protein HY720_06380, partial [Planctomycetes bacterium]|nr:hypothetical protein [Planctomycetota bacterium]